MSLANNSTIKGQELRKIEVVTDEVLAEVVQRIVTAVAPERIVLFGSYAYGDFRADSDLDLLVIMASDQPRWRRSIPVSKALRGLIIPKDVVVYTPEEVEGWSEVPQAFITTITHEGKVLYEEEPHRPG